MSRIVQNKYLFTFVCLVLLTVYAALAQPVQAQATWKQPTHDKTCVAPGLATFAYVTPGTYVPMLAQTHCHPTLHNSLTTPMKPVGSQCRGAEIEVKYYTPVEVIGSGINARQIIRFWKQVCN